MSTEVTAFQAAPPGSPAIGDTYGVGDLVGTVASGLYLGHDGEIAEWTVAGLWYFRKPEASGDSFAYVTGTPATTYLWNGTLWEPTLTAGAISFTDLNDTPGSLTADQDLEVNAGGTAIQFKGKKETFTSLTDTPTTFAGSNDGGHVVSVNAAGTGLEFDSVQDLLNFYKFAQLGDFAVATEFDTGLFFDPPTNSQPIYWQRFNPGAWPAGTADAGTRTYRYTVAHGIAIDTNAPCYVLNAGTLFGGLNVFTPNGSYSGASPLASYAYSVDIDGTNLIFSAKVINHTNGNPFNTNLALDPNTLGSRLDTISFVYSR